MVQTGTDVVQLRIIVEIRVRCCPVFSVFVKIIDREAILLLSRQIRPGNMLNSPSRYFTGIIARFFLQRNKYKIIIIRLGLKRSHAGGLFIKETDRTGHSLPASGRRLQRS